MIFYNYLKDLSKKSKLIFTLVIIVCFIYIENIVVQINNINYLQITPFTGYAMYSNKVSSKKYYPCYLVTINNNEQLNFWKLTQQNKQILQQAIYYYVEVQKSNFKDFKMQTMHNKIPFLKSVNSNRNNQKNFEKDFKYWYKCYLEQSIGKKIYKYKVQIKNLTYDDKKSKIIPIETIEVFNYKWNR